MNKTKLEALVESAMILVVLNTHVAGAPVRQPAPKPNPSGGGKSRQATGKATDKKRVSLLKSARVMPWLLLPMLIEWLGLPGLGSFQDLYGQLEAAMFYEKRSRATFLDDLTAALH